MNHQATKFKKLCVTHRRGGDFYPPYIPRERGNLATILNLTISTGLFLYDCVTSTISLDTILMHYATAFHFKVLLNILHRFIRLLEELRHFTPRYNRNVLTLLDDCLSFSNKTWFTIAGSVMYSTYFVSSKGLPEMESMSGFHIVSLMTVTFLLEKLLKLNSCPLRDSQLISEIHGMDYGSGMAYSFFYGYLKLVLPKTGDESKNLRELMEDYEAQEDIKFEAYKLFVLIPKSLRCFISLADRSHSIEESKSLPEKRITVAGVPNRVYKNAVYKIKDEGSNKIYYLCAEYATPLKTYNDVINNIHANSAHYEKHKGEITLRFYLTLKEILKAEKLDDFCEPIFFQDSYEDTKTSETRYYDVGKILMARLNEIKKYHRKFE